MKHITSSQDLIKEWNITVADFENGEWGNLMGKFKVYRSLVSAWTKVELVWDYTNIPDAINKDVRRTLGSVQRTGDVLEPVYGDLVVSLSDTKMYLYTTSKWVLVGDALPATDGAGQQLTRTVVDRDKLLKEITLLYIKGLYGIFPQLREIGYSRMLKHTQNFLKEAVLLATQHALKNRSVLERMTNIAKEGVSVKVSADPTNIVLPMDMYGQHGSASIRLSDIADYDIIGYDDAKVMTEKGNVIFIGKLDPKLIMDMD